MDCKSRMKALACAYLRRENLMNIPKVCNIEDTANIPTLPSS